MAVADIVFEVHQPDDEADRILAELERKLHKRFPDQAVALGWKGEGRRMVPLMGISGEENRQLVRRMLVEIQPRWNKWIWLD